MKHMAIEHSDKLAAARLWAVGWVATGHEIEVAERLRDTGLAETYCPRFRELRGPWRRREAFEEIKAVFPGYIFAVAESIGNAEAIYEIPEFHYFLRWEEDGRLQTVLDEAIEAVKDLERRGILLPTSIESLVASFAMGQRVKVVSGPFGGMVGTVVSEDSGRVMVAGGDFTFGTELSAEILATAEPEA